MKRVLQYIFCPLIIFTSFFIASQSTNASEMHLVISPVNVFLDLEIGSEVEKEFKLENAGSDTTEYKIYASPYTLDDNTGEANFEEDNIYSELKDWITFYDGENYQKTLTGTLEPNSSITIKYKINVPSDPSAVGQYAGVFAETVDGTEGTAIASVKASVRIGLNLIAKTNAEERLDAEIIANDAPFFLLGSNITSNFGVENSSNVHVDAIQNFKVENIFGGLIYEDEVAKIIMPEKTLFAETSWEESPKVGIYRVLSTVSVPALNLISTKTTIVVAIPPVLLAIIIVLIAAIMTIIIILITRKHKLNKLRRSIA